jgi:hypothetical protein
LKTRRLEKKWSFYFIKGMPEKNSSHLEWRVGLSDTILKGTHPGTIYAKFGSIWPSCFRGEDF